MRKHMAKSDSFYIRLKATTNGATYAQEEGDLGSFVNLGVKSSTLLRIHNIQVQIADDGGPENPISGVAGASTRIAWQLCTQSQTAMVYADDKSLISSGGITMYPGETGSGVFNTANSVEDFDVNVANWTNGYLVGVDTIFLGVDASGTPASGEAVVSLVLECTLETATQASATALALSQQ